MSNAPFALDRREFIALAGGLAAVLVIGDGAYFASPQVGRPRPAHLPNPAPSPSQRRRLMAQSPHPTQRRPAAAASPETESAAATNSETPPTTLEDLPWNLRLVNRDHPLAADFRAQQSGRASRRELGGAPTSTTE